MDRVYGFMFDLTSWIDSRTALVLIGWFHILELLPFLEHSQKAPARGRILHLCASSWHGFGVAHHAFGSRHWYLDEAWVATGAAHSPWYHD